MIELTNNLSFWFFLNSFDLRDELLGVLRGDPRPSYQDDPQREYGFSFADFEVSFKVEDKILNVTKIEKI